MKKILIAWALTGFLANFSVAENTPIYSQSSSIASSHLQAADTQPSQDLKQEIDSYLFDAARAGNVEMLKVFVESGYDLNRQDAKGYTALILAAYNGKKEAVDFLLDNGADPCTEDKRGNTALLGAIFKGEVRIARTLMKAECTTNHQNNAGQTPAMYAALFQRSEILDALKENGADLTLQDHAGNSVESLQMIATQAPHLQGLPSEQP